jgi:hypothetical protein
MSAARRARLPVLVVLLGLLLWSLLPEPATPIAQIEVPAEPVDEVEVGCDQPVEPLGPLDTEQPVLLWEPTPPPSTGTARCPVPPDVIDAMPDGTVRIDRLSRSEFYRPDYDDSALLIPSFSDLVGGTLYLDGYAPAQLTFVDGVCTVHDLLQQAAIAGTITPTVGAEAGQVTIQGCGANTTVDADGAFFAQINPSPCSLFAVRQDGELSVRSNVLDLDPQPGDELLVVLTLPTWHAASAGLTLSTGADDVIEISRVAPDSAAEDLGLRVGDVVLEIDGEPLADLPLWDVQDLAVGPEGTEVTYTVVRDGVVVELVLDREVQE